ncbi:MAG: NADH-quinone oxidoreductase subunit M [Chthoniobacterales bacterium]|nr:NADH-quinone oxidoreductase subunit M [Chthoniobacterales bacterium]
MILTATFLSAFLGAGLILLLPERRASLAKWIALLAVLAGLGGAKFAFLSFDHSPAAPDYQFLTWLPWIPQLGISFFTGADGISVVLLLLTGIIAVTGVLFSWNVTHRPRAFFAFYLIIIGGVYGVFQSFDLFLLFVFYEIVIIPKYFLIAAWGSTNREYGAMKLTMYSVAGSALVLLALIATYAVSGAQTFDLFVLSRGGFSSGFQAWAFPVMFIGFAVLAGLWPLHTWAPTGHVAAPTAVSMLLAGVVMKLGSYSALRVAMTLFPEGLGQWRTSFAILATAGIVLGALVALAQKDLKFTVGYSSIAHMGFVLLGLMTLNRAGMGGAVLQMFSHGIIGGLLFAVVGRMIYDRTHTRDIADLGKMDLLKALPFATLTFTIASVASMGLPGFSGFIAELTILKGSWIAFPWLLVPAGVGIVITVAFTLRALQRAFYPSGEPMPQSFDPITFPEKLGAVLLMAVTVCLGVFPSMLLNPILRSFQAPLMHHLVQEVTTK